MLRALVGLLAALATAMSATACSSGSPGAAPAPAVTTPSVSPCPTPAKTAHPKWPAAVPADLPKPPNAHIIDVQPASDGVNIVKFTTPTSLREGVIFVVDKLPKAGYILGRGDAEASEADAPFVHNDIRGLYRLFSNESCQTLWLLATVKANSTATGGNTSPLLPPHSPSGSPSPLPFG